MSNYVSEGKQIAGSTDAARNYIKSIYAPIRRQTMMAGAKKTYPAISSHKHFVAHAACMAGLTEEPAW